jgi:nucleotide-binding universal stress UspA family protein
MSSVEAKEEKGRMIVGVDGSPSSLAALRWASENAKKLECLIEVICTWEEYIPSGELLASGMAPGLVIPEMTPEELALDVLRESTKEVFGETRSDEVTIRVIKGEPSRVLIRESENATMLVLGSRGHGKLHDLVLGSVSSSCVAKAKCPVVVLHEKA